MLVTVNGVTQTPTTNYTIVGNQITFGFTPDQTDIIQVRFLAGSTPPQSATQLVVYANTTVRDSAITSPQTGMMIYVTGLGMQVRGATSWNTIIGTDT